MTSEPADPARRPDAGSGADPLTTLRIALRQLRRRNGMTQRDLIRPLRLASHSTIVDYESGRRIPPPDVVAAYERLFNTPAGALERLRVQAVARRADVESGRQVADPTLRRSGRGVPWQLLASPSHFTGRTQDLAVLTAAARHIHRTGTTHVFAIVGMAGIGKTSLATTWGHRERDRFPDGALHVDMRGFHPAGTPLAPGEVLTMFLRALDVPNEQIPVTVDEMSALYRTLLASRRMLIVLDNARSAEQVRPLLPGAQGCLTLVTSRNRLAGLVARDGAAPLSLCPLPMDDAIALLRKVIGPTRADASSPIAALAQWCGCNPLALRVAAERVVSRPEVSVAAVVDELGDRHQRLARLAPPDDSTSAVSTVFGWSYEVLPPASRWLFRCLGLHPGPEVEPLAAAALAGLPVEAAAARLDDLAAANLLDPAAAGRYRVHDLVRLYAANRSSAEDAPPDREAAVRRLCGWYLHTAVAARVALSPGLPPMRPEYVALLHPPLAFADHATALAWCEAERQNITAAVLLADRYGMHTLTWQLSTAMYAFYDLRKHYRDWITTHRLAINAARAGGDREAEGRAECNLGNAYRPLRRLDEALGCYERARDLFEQVGYRQGHAKVLGNLGLTYDDMGRYADAARAHEQAIGIFQELGDRYGEALALTNLGEMRARLGEHDRGIARHRNALRLFRAIGDRHGEARALANMAWALNRSGQPFPARRYGCRALELFSQLGDRYEEANVRATLGEIEEAVGDATTAVDHRRQALALYEEIGDEYAAAAARSALAAAAPARDGRSDDRDEVTGAR